MSATAAPGRTPRALADRLARLAGERPLLAAAALLALLCGLSTALRTQALDAKLWIDEGLSIGIASHAFTDIPSVLQQDGSPPLYYLLLHLWIEALGDGEARTHALSLAFSLGTIPAGFWAGRALFGTRAAWATAALAALNPYLTFYAQETRMYSLLALLSLGTTATFALTFAQRRRGALPAFVVLAALLAYTHNWGLFLLAGTAAAVVGLVWQEEDAQARRGLVRDAAIGYGALALLYAAWLPTLVGQARETGAPWAERPGLHDVVVGFTGALGGDPASSLAAFMAITGLVATIRGARRSDPVARALLAIAGAGLVGVLLAFLASQVSPAWASRYLGAFLGPVLLLLGAGLTRYGRLGLVALGIVLLLWLDPREDQLRGKSNAFKVARTLQDEGYVRDGDVVLTTHPEYGPVMRYYLGDGLRWADALGWVRDPQIFDWRDALDRLERTGPITASRQVLPALRPGQHLLLIQPIIRTGRWGAPWTRLVRRRAAKWERALDHTGGLARVEPVPSFTDRRLPRGVRAVVYRRTPGPLRIPAPDPPAPPEDPVQEPGPNVKNR
ncbi:MAG TPA: glycosyltransferase family 39 protein [Baekduia sp.]|nr:glycosyltransferase family 39 protein [Baekduia sp.]